MTEDVLKPRDERIKATDEMPILRIAPDHVDRLNFDALLTENEEFETFAFSVGRGLVEYGVYDDSDYDGSYTLIYTTDRHGRVKEQMEAREGIDDFTGFDRNGSIEEMDPEIQRG